MVMVRNLVKVGNREIKKRYVGNKLIFEDLGDKTDTLSGTEIYTDKADEGAVVHVGIDGKSYQEDEPSPDNPSEIHSLNDFDVVSSTEKLSEGQLEEYNYDTEYENFYKINLSLDEPLRSVGDVKDRLFRDSDGLWKIERKTKEVHMGNQYKATNDLVISETPEGMKIYYLSGYLTIRMNGRTTHINSTHFSYNPKANRGSRAKLHHVGTNGSSGELAHHLRFAVHEDDFPTLNSFNNWLVEEENSGTPVTLQVQLRLEDIHIETLDQELQDKLNNLRSFQDSNYVYTVVDNADISPTLHTTFKSKGWYDYYLKTLLK